MVPENSVPGWKKCDPCGILAIFFARNQWHARRCKNLTRSYNQCIFLGLLERISQKSCNEAFPYKTRNPGLMIYCLPYAWKPFFYLGKQIRPIGFFNDTRHDRLKESTWKKHASKNFLMSHKCLFLLFVQQNHKLASCHWATQLVNSQKPETSGKSPTTIWTVASSGKNSRRTEQSSTLRDDQRLYIGHIRIDICANFIKTKNKSQKI